MTHPSPAPRTPLPDQDHVLRYIGRKHVDNGVVSGSGFLARPRDQSASSVNWMECFPPPPEDQVTEISARRRLKYEKRAVLVRLNVKRTRHYVTDHAPIDVTLSFEHDPRPAENGYPEDSSHALIRGIPTVDTAEGEAVQDLFTHCIVNQYPVTPDK